MSLANEKKQCVAELVCRALADLREPNGSSVKRIREYIESEYKIPDVAIKKYVMTALQRGVAFGMISKNHGNYQLSELVDNIRTIAPCRRRRRSCKPAVRRCRRRRRSCGRRRRRRCGRPRRRTCNSPCTNPCCANRAKGPKVDNKDEEEDDDEQTDRAAPRAVDDSDDEEDDEDEENDNEEDDNDEDDEDDNDEEAQDGDVEVCDENMDDVNETK